MLKPLLIIVSVIIILVVLAVTLENKIKEGKIVQSQYIVITWDSNNTKYIKNKTNQILQIEIWDQIGAGEQQILMFSLKPNQVCKTGINVCWGYIRIYDENNMRLEGFKISF